ncbi:hypothetical protein F4779DRAFT_625071 [Xylariaceae sp. FL0662B]|nr:hypothetical protein F4779DRAFT_625071 [Xylariaceae sp. FL0662B]
MSVSENLDGQNEPVAIVGMGCRWAGGIRDPPGLWELLKNKRDGWREFDEPRFSTEGFHHANPDRPGTMRTRGGFLVNEDVRLFDHAFFDITGREVETMDPSQRKLLEVVYEAFENAGETWESVDGSRTGVCIGNFAFDHMLIQARDWENPKPYAATGADTSILANRISYIFNLHGPSLATNTACSSSMYALHMAIGAIRNGDCNGAVVAAANWISDPSMQIVLDKLGALSPTSRCHTFDASADGYARGEGYASLYLKKSSIAVLDGLPIRAMVRGTAVNANGRTGVITRPSAMGQEDVIRRAYKNAGNLRFSDTAFFECHGTGTQVGDPLEVSAVGNVFASSRSDAPKDRLLIGSIKPSLGHTEGASAIASIMKVVLALEAGEIPPTCGVEKLNPNIDFEKAKGKCRRASVNSFGFGGANGHCIIDHVNVVLPEYMKPGVIKGPDPFANGHAHNGSLNGNHTNNRTTTQPPKHSPVTCKPNKTARADASTRHYILSDVIGQWPLADVAYTLGCKRSRLQQRSFRIVDKDDIVTGLAVEDRVLTSLIQTANIAYVFTGQGAQWHAMGAQLLEYDVFRAAIVYLDFVLGALPTPPSWSIFHTISGACAPDHVQLPQIGLVDLLASWSVRPVAVVGHSSGEMAAAYASGKITAAYFRGQAVCKNKEKGAMLTVGMSDDQVSDYLDGKEEQIKIAAINSPSSVTLSGDVDAIKSLSTILTKEGVFTRVLRTGGNAYHSHHMMALGSDFSDMLSSGVEHIKKLGLVNPVQRYLPIPWVSSVTPDKLVADSEVTFSYWRANLESPVRFTQAVNKMMSLENSAPIDILVEIGPHSALKSPLDQILKSIGKPARYASALKRDEDSRFSVLRLAGSLFGLNAEIDMAAVNAVDDGVHEGNWSLTHGCTAVDLPTYQFSYGPVSYYECRASKEYRLREVLQPQWRNVLRVKDLPWLRDHRLIPDAVFPGAGFVVMAVEAALRVYCDTAHSSKITGYSLRNVDIKTALRIPEDDYGVEIILSMELVDTQTAKSPSWAKFTVSSVARDSNDWAEHCTGLVRVEISRQPEKDKINAAMDARSPDLSSWHNRFAEIGIGYGSTFQSLSELQVDPFQNLAKASVALNTTTGTIEGGESTYALHPAALDATFQLGLIACYGGQVERATTAFLPVHLSQVYLKAEVGGDMGTAVARGRIQGIRNAYVQLQMMNQGGDVVLEVDTLRLTRFKESSSAEEAQSKKLFSSPFTRLAWKPDFRTLNNDQARKLFPAPPENTEGIEQLERADMISCLVVAEIYEEFVRGGNGPRPKGELNHWLSWVRRCVEQDRRANMVEARQLSPDQRRHLLQKLYEEAGDRPEAMAAKVLHKSMGELLNERKTGIDVLVSEGLLTALYEAGHAIAGSHIQLFNVLDSLSHANPHLRILEIGAGTGAATRVAMKALTGPQGFKRYADYTFTDISAGFLRPAREIMSDYRDVNYSVLDIDKDPLTNGYEPVYDVIVACEAIHATASMDRTLAHCRSLFKARVMLGLLYGTLTGYWLGASDGRTEGPFMDQPTWDLRLRKVGFSGTECFLDDYPHPHNSTSVIVSTLLEEKGAENYTNNVEQDGVTVHLLHDYKGAPPLLRQIAAEFKHRGTMCRTSTLDEALGTVSSNSRVVAFITSLNDLFDGDEDRLKSFQHLTRHAKSMVWLTSGGIIKGRDPRAGFMIGLLRATATENPAGHFLSVDIDTENFVSGSDDLVRSIVDHEFTLQREESSEQNGDREFAWQDGCMWVSRVVPDAGLGVYTETVKTPTCLGAEMLPLGRQGPLCAGFETPGILASLYFRPYTELLQPLPADYIDVKVAAVGLNWKDLALTSGRFDAINNDLSSEYAGVITRTGTNVVDLSVGDRVYGVGRGHFGNYTRVPAAFTQKLQPTDDIVEVATMPLVYMTALYALDNVAGLRRGQKVLIQSATGGLGLAAIQLAQSKGAEVFATAGAADKATGKGGFDIILGTVAGGDLLSESLKALGPMGHLIDLSRVDKNVSFSSFDLNIVLDNNPDLGSQLMKSVDKLYRAGRITPIRPFSVFDVSRLDQALLSFSKGKHIGKLIVSFQNPSVHIKVVQQPPQARFDFTARYIITGGLGGLGRSIIRWMSDRGAHDFVILSRRGISTPAARLLIDDLTTRGVRVQVMACDVSKKEEVMTAIHKASLTDRPVKGVIHAALTLSDLSFDKLTIDQWKSGLAAKTVGTVNLHEATASLPLDFFIMLTSTESVWAPPTQSSYIAATNFQEYFARYRRSLGLPASTAAYGLVSDVGSDFKLASVGTADMYARNKVLTTTEWQVLATLEPAFLNSPSTQWVGQKQDPLSAANYFTCLDPSALAGITSTNVPRWHSDGRVVLILRAMNDAQRHAKNDAGDDNNTDNSAAMSAVARLRHGFDEAIKAGPEERTNAVEFVIEGVMRTIAEMLFIDIRNVIPDKSVAEHGVDSLVAAELRHWFHQALRTNLQMSDLLDAATSIRALAESIVDKALKG